MAEKIKVQFGCGEKYKKGWVNVDYYNSKCDVKHDLNKFPYPFKANSVDEILMEHVLEHLDEPLKVMDEFYRISKNTARIIIRVPHFSSSSAFTDLTHKHFFTSRSLDYWDEKTHIGKALGFETGANKFKIVNKKLNFVKGMRFWNYPVEWFFNISPFFMRFYEATFFRALFPAEELYFELEVLK